MKLILAILALALIATPALAVSPKALQKQFGTSNPAFDIDGDGVVAGYDISVIVSDPRWQQR